MIINRTTKFCAKKKISIGECPYKAPKNIHDRTSETVRVRNNPGVGGLLMYSRGRETKTGSHFGPIF